VSRVGGGNSLQSDWHSLSLPINALSVTSMPVSHPVISTADDHRGNVSVPGYRWTSGVQAQYLCAPERPAVGGVSQLRGPMADDPRGLVRDDSRLVIGAGNGRDADREEGNETEDDSSVLSLSVSRSVTHGVRFT